MPGNADAAAVFVSIILRATQGFDYVRWIERIPRLGRQHDIIHRSSL